MTNININDSPLRIEKKTIRKEDDTLKKGGCKVVKKWSGRKDLVCMTEKGKIIKKRIH